MCDHREGDGSASEESVPYYCHCGNPLEEEEEACYVCVEEDCACVGSHDVRGEEG